MPPGKEVYLEFQPANKLFGMADAIDIKIIDGKDRRILHQYWNLSYSSDTLKKMLSILHWTIGTITSIKKWASDAHCISIENGAFTEIGFARSGMGKYSCLLFNNRLTPKQAKEYNDACTYIYYKDNIVLEYEGGAIGAQCFPD